MAAENKTEQATPRRKQKAREKGQVARSRELSSAVATVGAVAVVAWQAASLPTRWLELLRSMLRQNEASTPGYSMFTNGVLLPVMSWAAPPLGAAFVLAVAASVAQGGFVLAPGVLAPNVARVNPAAKIGQMFSIGGLSNLLKSMIPFSAIAYVLYSTLRAAWPTLVQISFSGTRPLVLFLFATAYSVIWKSALVLLLWSGIDYWLVRTKFEGELRMTRQEVRDEAKETEGNALVKGRIRRLQRQVRRRRMLQDVEKATVVITNPTHFAVALRYDDEVPAPVVVAKGRNLLAQQIKQTATWHGITLVENPPLAHVLYRTVEIGQTIPAKLYTAVAEILAFVYRTQQRTANATGAAR